MGTALERMRAGERPFRGGEYESGQWNAKFVAALGGREEPISPRIDK
jgi:hypothetical protein